MADVGGLIVDTARAAGLDGPPPDNPLNEAARGIVDRLKALADEQVRKKKPTEERWLEDLRAFHGRYDETTEQALRQDTTRSRIFVNETRSKTNGWEARLSDLLFPADDKNWGIQPTPNPTLAKEAKDALAQAQAAHAEAEQAVERANRMDQAEGQSPAAMEPEFAKAAAAGERAVGLEAMAADKQAIMDEARKRAEAMSHTIDDQLTECQWPKRARDVIKSGCRLGPGVVKGPLTANRGRRSWSLVGNDATLNYAPDDRPEFVTVNVWNFFPDMDATSIETAGFTFERHLPTKKGLRKMHRELGYDGDAVRRLLIDGPDRNPSADLNHLTQLRAINNEGEAVTGRYIVWEYHGPLEVEEICQLMRASGRAEDAEAYALRADPLDEIMVIVHFCNGELLKLAEEYTLDSNETLYSIFEFEGGEASILGAIGVPRIMADSQRVLNASWRMMIDNAALSVGPQIVIDKSQVEPEDGSWKLTPRKVWIKKGADLQASNPPFQAINIPMNQAQLAGIIELALKFIDEETGLPMIAQGEQGAHITQTSSGMSMLFNSANVVFRRVVKSWDDGITTPMIRRLYDWNMQFSDDPSIKGDMQVEARGTSALLVKEMQAQALTEIAAQWSVHPTLGMMLKGQGYDTARMAISARSINPDDVLKSRDDFEKDSAAAAANPQQSPDAIRAAASIEVAKVTAKSREMEVNAQLQIASLNRDTELTKLANAQNMGLEKLKTLLLMKDADIQHRERTHAADIAVEDQRQREAAAAGASPTTVAEVPGQGVG